MELQLPDRYALDPDRPVLGEGGMGRVYKARDIKLDTPVALKVVRPDLAADRRFRKLFDFEVRMAARFTHPHIVPLHDSDTLPDGTPFLGLALADGGSFANLAVAPPDWGEVRRLVIQLLEALAHLHARDVLHRDLKPENVLLHSGPDGRPDVWLADLGLANAGGALAKKKGRVEGTPGYMAPEQRLGLPREYGPSTDLFSLGVILWELVTGDLPFPDGRSPLDAELPPLIPRPEVDIPDGLDIVLANLLSAEPLSRYDLASDVRTELLALDRPSISGADIRSGARPAPQPPRMGTVARSAPHPSSGTEAPGEGEAPGEVDFVYGVPLWNRPVPSTMPEEPPAEPGFGATARGSLPLFALRELPLVARERYRRQLWALCRSTSIDGRPRVVVVVGEAGCGKSRLVQSVVHTLMEGGWAEPIECHYQRTPGKEDGYAGAARALVKPWNESRKSLEARLRRRIARERGVLDEAVKEEVSTLARWCGLLEEGEEPLSAGYGLREVYRQLDARSWRGLSLLVLEDAQWAAEEGDGLAIAESVLLAADEGVRRRLVVVATLRSESLAENATLAAQVEQLVADGALRIDLPRLDRGGTESLLAESLNLTSELRRRVATRCEGNPLFARQLLVEWANRGWLVDNGRLEFELAPGVDADAVLPADAEALFRNRIASVAAASGAEERFVDVLHTASLAGTELPVAVLQHLAGQDLYPFLRACGLFVERDDRMHFSHGLLHQTVRQQADERRDRVRLHRKLARTWSRLGRRGFGDVAFEVGRHAHAGEEWPLAVRNLLRACQSAHERGLTQQMVEATDLLCDAVDASTSHEEYEGWALYWRARARQGVGDVAGAAAGFEAARSRFGLLFDVRGTIRATIGLGWTARQTGDFAEAEKRYGEAMQEARSMGDALLEAEAIAGMAWLEQQKRNFQGADILFTRVLNRCTQLDDKRGLAAALLGQALVARRRGDLVDARELYEEARQASQDGDDLLGVARAAVGLAQVLVQRRDLDGAERGATEALRTAEELAATQLAWEARLALTGIHRARGDLDRARRVLTDLRSWASRQQVFEMAVLAELGLAYVARDGGDLEALYAQLQAAGERLGDVPGHWLWATYRLVGAVLLARRGNGDQAYRWLWSASELGLGDTVDPDVADCLTELGDIGVQRGWSSLVRVAGKLALEQWRRLDDAERVAHVKGWAGHLQAR